MRSVGGRPAAPLLVSLDLTDLERAALAEQLAEHPSVNAAVQGAQAAARPISGGLSGAEVKALGDLYSGQLAMARICDAWPKPGEVDTAHHTRSLDMIDAFFLLGQAAIYIDPEGICAANFARLQTYREAHLSNAPTPPGPPIGVEIIERQLRAFESQTAR
ncbi:MAG: hypothetical protein ACKVPX_06905 [Myxococcaceae bacterium]